MYAILIKSQLAACKSTSSPEVTSRPSSRTSAIERNQQLAFRPNARHTATDSRIDRRPMRRVERGRVQRGACAQGRMPVVWQWIPRSTKGQSAGAGPGAPVFVSPRGPGWPPTRSSRPAAGPARRWSCATPAQRVPAAAPPWTPSDAHLAGQAGAPALRQTALRPALRQPSGPVAAGCRAAVGDG